MLELLQHESSKNILPWYWTFILPVSSCLVIWILLKILLSHPILSALYPFRCKMGLNKDLHILYNNMNAQEVYQSVINQGLGGFCVMESCLPCGNCSLHLEQLFLILLRKDADRACREELHMQKCVLNPGAGSSGGFRQWHPAEVEEGWC